MAAMDDKVYCHIPNALFDAITFLAQTPPKRSVPTWLELLFGAMLTQTVLSPKPIWRSLLGGTGPVILSGSKKATGHGSPWGDRQADLAYDISRVNVAFW